MTQASLGTRHVQKFDIYIDINYPGMVTKHIDYVAQLQWLRSVLLLINVSVDLSVQIIIFMSSSFELLHTQTLYFLHSQTCRNLTGNFIWALGRYYLPSLGRLSCGLPITGPILLHTYLYNVMHAGHTNLKLQPHHMGGVSMNYTKADACVLVISDKNYVKSWDQSIIT